MPDESCRKCGEMLYVFSKCSECRIITREICLKCGRKTMIRYHCCSMMKKISIC
jgi:rRNA maturation protein Nop10